MKIRTCRNCGIKSNKYLKHQESLYQNRYFCKDEISCATRTQLKNSNVFKALQTDLIENYTRNAIKRINT